MITIDANVLVKLVIDENQSESVKRIIYETLSKDEPIIAPNMALFETMNVLWDYSVNRKKLNNDDALLAFDRLSRIWARIKHVDSDDLHKVSMTVALDSKLTIYDSLYVATSILYKSPLLTFDKEIHSKAKTLGVALVSLKS
jgi:predicted nucleic acid-binding protein